MKSWLIAIADDNEILREELACMLKRKGINVTISAQHGKDLLEQLERAPELPQLCICDINMPIMDGFETAKKLKAMYPQINLLAFSTDESEWLQSEILRCGADAFIPKHSSIQEYIGMISAVINAG